MTQTVAERSAYQAAWRAAHPGYDRARRVAKRDLIGLQHQAWKRANPTIVAAARARYATAHPRPTIDTTPVPPLHRGHPLFERARQLVREARGSYFQFRDELDREDARSEAVLAMLTGADPVEAVRIFLAGEAAWRNATLLIREWGA